MSEENVELVRRWLAWMPDLRDVDPADVDAGVEQAFRDYLDEEFEIPRIPGYYPDERPVFKGRDGVARYVAWLRDSWSAWRFWPERFFDAGDHVVVFGRVVAKGRSSGVPIELPIAQVLTIRNGRMTSLQVYPDRPEALKAVGLEPQAMSANLELVRSICAAWERGDYSSAQWADPEIEYVVADGPAPGSWTGVASMTAGWRDVLRAWVGLGGGVDECRELDDGRVLVLYRLTGHGRTSGVDLGQVRAQGTSIFSVREGKVTKLVSYLDRERALADLGLAPNPDSSGA